MFKSDYIQYLFDWHNIEYQKKLELDNAINVPLVLITGVIGLVFFLVDNFNPKYENQEQLHLNTTCLEILFICCFVITFLFLIVAIFLIARSYMGLFKSYGYYPLSHASQFKNYLTDKVKEFGSSPSNVKRVSHNLDKVIIDDLIVSIDNNTKINELRMKYLHQSKMFIGLSIVFVIISFVLFIINNYYRQ